MCYVWPTLVTDLSRAGLNRPAARFILAPAGGPRKGDSDVPRQGRIHDRGFWWACTECRNRNYTSFKNKRNDPERMKLRKYCSTCRRHTEHRETGLTARASGR